MLVEVTLFFQGQPVEQRHQMVNKGPFVALWQLPNSESLLSGIGVLLLVHYLSYNWRRGWHGVATCAVPRSPSSLCFSLDT